MHLVLISVPFSHIFFPVRLTFRILRSYNMNDPSEISCRLYATCGRCILVIWGEPISCTQFFLLRCHKYFAPWNAFRCKNHISSNKWDKNHVFRFEIQDFEGPFAIEIAYSLRWLLVLSWPFLHTVDNLMEITKNVLKNSVENVRRF